MKQILLLFISLLSCSLVAQTELYVGKYELRIEASNAIHSYEIQLNPNGTFLFHRYHHGLIGDDKEENTYGKGVWKSHKKNLIYFFTNHKNDIDATHSLNLNNSKARFISKSPRDKSDRIIRTALKFYESELPWVTGKELFKIE